MKKVITLLSAALCAVGAWAQNVHNGHEYVDLGLPSGTLWATCNVGAENPEDMGEYFMWGEAEPNTYYDYPAYKWNKYSGALRITKYTFDDGQTETWDDLTELEADDDAALYNFGNGWSTPTPAQLSELVENCSWTWTADYKGDGTNIAGYIVASKAEENDNFIFLPAAGHKWTRDLMYSNEGFYMSNALSSEDYAESIILIFNENNLGAPNTYPRYRGYSVRPVYVPEPIAQITIGETTTGYADTHLFKSAIEAIEGVASIKFVDNITAVSLVNLYLSSSSDITIDLNGKSVDNIYFNVSGKLTINDSSEEETSMVTFDPAYPFDVNEGAELIINGGSFYGSYYVNGGEGRVILNGGHFKEGSYGTLSEYAILGEGKALKLKDGTIITEITETITQDCEVIDAPSTPTAIESVDAEKSGKVIKTIENGKVVIIRNNKKYDLSGREL